MTQRDYTRNVKIGDTVYINTRSKNHMGKSAVVLLKDYRRAKVQFEDGSTTWFSFYSIDTELIDTGESDDGYKFANIIGNSVACPHCKRVLFDYKNTILDIEAAIGNCKFCHTKVKWDLREARKKAEDY